MIVRFGKPRYDEKKKISGRRKPTIFSEKSHAERMKGGAKVMVAFKDASRGKGAKRGSSRRNGKRGKRS